MNSERLNSIIVLMLLLRLNVHVAEIFFTLNLTVKTS